jgi:hypothetical protein
LYFTVACVAEVRVTEVTTAESPAASGLLDREVMALEKAVPFCSSATRSLLGVEEEKNFSQLALIWASAVPLVPLPVLPELVPPELAVVGVAAAEEADAAGADAAGLEEDEELLVEQAVAIKIAAMAVVVARPFAGWNRICHASRCIGRNRLAFLVCIVCPTGIPLLRQRTR